MKTSRVKDVRHLRINNNKFDSFRILKSSPPLNIIKKKDIFFPVLLEGLVKFLQVFNPGSSVSENYFKSELRSYIEEAKINSDIEIIDLVENNVINNVYNEYRIGKDNFHAFIGKIVEFIVVMLEKDSSCKVYHEPIFRHKNKRLVQKRFKGNNCLIDVVKVNINRKQIKFIECKAKLDPHIKSLSSTAKKIAFKNKINFINYIDKLISTYYYDTNKKVKTEKVFATLSDPKRELPSQCSDYKVINVLTLLLKKIDDGVFAQLIK